MEQNEILDPSVCLYFKLTIEYILNAVPKESKPAIYMLNGNQMRFVDVIAKVCNVYDMEKLYKVYLTDETGFIPCTIWKRETPIPKNPPPVSDRDLASPEELLIQSLHRSLTLRENFEPQIGQIIHIRGRISSYLEKLEITAYYYRLVLNSRELDLRLKEIKELYSKVYKQFWLNKSDTCVQQSIKFKKLQEMQSVILTTIETDGLNEFSIEELCLMDNLVAFVKQCDSEHLLGNSIRTKLDVVIENMIEKGLVFPSHLIVTNNQYYHLTKLCSKLRQEVRKYLKQLSETSQATDCGVSTITLIKELNKTDKFKHLTRNALKIALEYYEEIGIIYSCARNQYRVV